MRHSIVTVIEPHLSRSPAYSYFFSFLQPIEVFRYFFSMVSYSRANFTLFFYLGWFLSSFFICEFFFNRFQWETIFAWESAHVLNWPLNWANDANWSWCFYASIHIVFVSTYAQLSEYFIPISIRSGCEMNEIMVASCTCILYKILSNSLILIEIKWIFEKPLF